MASAATSVPPGSGAPGGGSGGTQHPPPASSAPPPQTTVAPMPSHTNIQPPTGLSGGPTSSAQHYSLRWNNHQSHVLNAFDALLQNESLVDCTLVCEDTSIRAHKVVLSACSPYFQKIFMDNPHKNPIIILKDVRGWEVQCIVDFMYKGETSVPEAQLTGLIKAAEGLKVRGLTSSDQVPRNANLHVDTTSPRSRHSSPMTSSVQGLAVNGYHHGAPPPSHHAGQPAHRGYSSSPARSYPSHHDPHHHDSHHGSHAKIPHLTGPHSNQSSPMSLTNHQDDRERSAHMQHNGDSGMNGSGPRRKQARPRRRSGDSVGNSSLDLSKSDSPINAGTPYNAHHGKNPGSSPSSSAGSSHNHPSHLHDDATPENLSMKRPSSSPAINLVKTETLLEQQDRARATSASSSELSQRAEREALRRERDRTHSRERTPIPDTHGSKPVTPSSPFLPAAAAAAALHGNVLHHFQEHPARQELEALQALDYMRAGGGLPPHFPPPPGHAGINGHSTHLSNGPGGQINASSLAGLAAVSAAAANAAAQAGRPTSTPNTPSAFGGHPPAQDNGKNNFEFQRIAFDRSKMSEEEAFEHAIEMIQTRQMGFRKAADFFSVSKWKLYKTARKRGIYAEIKKQNAAQQALTKVPTNVQHFADMGVYKQLKKKTHLTKEVLFPHLPGVANGVVPTNGHADAHGDPARKVFKSANAHNNNNLQHIPRDHRDHLNNHSSFVTMAEHLQKKMGYPPVHPNGRSHTGSPGPSATGAVDLHRSLSMPAQTTAPQMLPPQRSSGSGGDDEPISDIEEDECEDENIDVDEVDDDIPTKGDVLVQPTTLLNGNRHIGTVQDDDDDDSEPRRLVINTRDDVRITTSTGDRHGDSNGIACNGNESSSNGGFGENGEHATSPDEEDSSREDSA